MSLNVIQKHRLLFTLGKVKLFFFFNVMMTRHLMEDYVEVSR